MDNKTDFKRTKNEKINSSWNYHPELPIKNSGVFSWPLKPLSILVWIAKSWLRPSDRTLWLGMAIVTWIWCMPAVEKMEILAWDWIMYIYLRNLVSATIIATSIHLYFYTFKLQGSKLRYDKRNLSSQGSSARFTFNNQLLDNMFWSLASGVTVWTGFEVLYFWAFANGLMPALDWYESFIWFVGLFLLIPIWSSVHFYWIHRAIHWPPLYRIAHSVHHRNIITGPWSGLSMHPIEHLVYYSSIFLHAFVPSHPTHILFHFYILSLNPMTEHSGFDGLEIEEKNRFQLGNFFHQLHHRHFRCNYGTPEMPWDRWFGSFHDGTPEASKRIQRRPW